MALETVYIYTDASFNQRHKIAIIGHFYLFENENNKFHQQLSTPVFLEQIQETSNIRAEIRSSLNAIKKAPKALEFVLYTDCESLCNLPSRRENLEKTNFMSRKKSIPLNNADLYKEFFKVMDSVQLKLIWVKGHSPNRNNNPIESHFSVLDKKVRKQLREVISIQYNN